MKVYVPLGYYNDNEDIIDLFPSNAFKGDEADIVVNYLKNNYGAFHTIDNPDIDSFISPAEASKDSRIVFSSDGQYVVSFTTGNYHLLHNGDDMHGFFIDIYHLEEVEDYDEYANSIPEPETVEDVRKLQATYDKLIVVREKIDKILMDIAPYVAQ